MNPATMLDRIGHSPLLQSRFDTQFVSEADTSTVIVAVVIIVGFVVVLLVAGAANNRKQRSSGSGGKRYTRGGFKRRAKQLGLQKTHIKTLEYVRDKYNIKNPMALLANSRQLDHYLNRAIQDIDQQVAAEDVKEAQKLTLYRIKQIIERNVQRTGTIGSSKQLKPGQKLTVSGQNGGRYRTHLVAVLKDGLAVAVPSSETGGQIRWAKWSPVEVFFWKSNGEGFSFESKVTGYNSFKGTPSVFLQHSSTIKSAKQRRFRRKHLESPCYFYPVRVMTVGSGRNEQKKAFVDTKKGMLGTIIEVSAGGCSIRANRVLKKAALVKVDFETERGVSVSSYGKVVEVRRENAMSTVMHIMFTRVTKKNLNLINAYIYEYGGE